MQLVAVLTLLNNLLAPGGLAAWVALGANVATTVADIKKVIDELAGASAISADDVSALNSRIADLEAAWQTEVGRAQQELDV